jgi:hypothetical protein
MKIRPFQTSSIALVSGKEMVGSSLCDDLFGGTPQGAAQCAAPTGYVTAMKPVSVRPLAETNQATGSALRQTPEAGAGVN